MPTDESLKLESTDVRKLLQQFNEDLVMFINAGARYKLGRVLTIIDATTGDTEQRKAIKDLVNEVWWSDSDGGISNSDIQMHNPHTDLRAICEVLGFTLYQPSGDSLDTDLSGSDIEWPKKRYTDVLAVRK